MTLPSAFSVLVCSRSSIVEIEQARWQTVEVDLGSAFVDSFFRSTRSGSWQDTSTVRKNWAEHGRAMFTPASDVGFGGQAFIGAVPRPRPSAGGFSSASQCQMRSQLLLDILDLSIGDRS